MRSVFRRASGAMLVVVAAFLATGCGSDKTSVKGKVSYKKKALVSGSVMFTGADGTPVYAEIQPDGTYTCADVPTGDLRVAVTSPDPSTTQAKKPERSGKSEAPTGSPSNAAATRPAGWFPIPPAYGSIESSGLKTTAGKPETTFDIELR